MERQLISSGSPYEHHIGLSRAVRVGPVIAVSGTAPLHVDGTTAHVGDVYAQTKRCLEIMVSAIERAGGARENVIRTRIMLVDIAQWKAAARAHGEVFAGVRPACTFVQIRPACTFVQISRFIDPEWLVETEADCYVP